MKEKEKGVGERKETTTVKKKGTTWRMRNTTQVKKRVLFRELFACFIKFLLRRLPLVCFSLALFFLSLPFQPTFSANVH